MRSKFVELSKCDLDLPESQRAAEALLDEIQTLPLRSDYPYDEPGNLISARNFAVPAIPKPERILGAWLGRCCGCLLGKPVEGWKRAKISGYLNDTNRWPLNDYFSKGVPNDILRKHKIDTSAAFLENAECMPEDDDLNYTVCGLAIVEEYGREFTPENVSEFWLQNLPLLHTCTAERVAYKSFANNIMPPSSATHRNPYREWIGAQIRGDFWGYINPGNPQAAAEMAWRDGSVSHVKNGIYGEMWVAAMLAAAFTTDDINEIIDAGLTQIPQRSRLAEAIKRQQQQRKNAIEDIHSRWNENRAHDWCHTIPNAEIVAMSLLNGGGDFERSICLAVQVGFDTDCNGATVGSILGAVLGEKNIPDKWKSPLNDKLETGVQGFHSVSISEMAERTAGILRHSK